ncbi:MAG: response regulator [Xanthobacteraceae bacterium]
MPPPAADDKSGSGASVAVVEDDPLIALDIASVLEEAGYKVIGPIDSVSDALSLATDRVDAAILDVNINDTPVWPVANVLREHGVPFMFLTGYARWIEFPQEFANAIRMEKPFEATDLMVAIAAVRPA